MKYTIAKMFQILRHNRWVSILMIIEIALGMSVFTYSLNMFFSVSREKENQKNGYRPRQWKNPYSAWSRWK